MNDQKKSEATSEKTQEKTPEKTPEQLALDQAGKADNQESVENEMAVRSWFHFVKTYKGKPIKGTERDEEELITVRQFVTEPAIIRRGYGLTINLGNFEAARLDVGISFPCYREEIIDADNFASDFCESRIKHEVAEMNKSRNGSGS